MDKREVAYTEARIDLLNEMMKAGAFDMDDHTRREFVAATVDVLRPRYPELDDHLWRQLIGNGMRATFGDASLAEAAREGRGTER